MFSKNFILFWVLSGLFVLTVVYVSTIYFGWNEELPADGVQVDISLPVVHWDEYLELSKSSK